MGKIIDIHAHVLPNVDHGSSSPEVSKKLLLSEKSQGVTDVILTPHLDLGDEINANKIKEDFLNFKKTAMSVNINLYLGAEIHVFETDREIPKNLITMNGTNYALFEFDFYSYCNIPEFVYEARLKGLKPIVAHIGRYEYVNLSVVRDIKENGGLIQLNAKSLFNLKKRRLARKLLKEGLVDFIASDIHEFRKNEIGRAYKFVERRYGKEISEKLFYLNAKDVIKQNG